MSYSLYQTLYSLRTRSQALSAGGPQTAPRAPWVRSVAPLWGTKGASQARSSCALQRRRRRGSASRVVRSTARYALVKVKFAVRPRHRYRGPRCDTVYARTRDRSLKRLTRERLRGMCSLNVEKAKAFQFQIKFQISYYWLSQ